MARPLRIEYPGTLYHVTTRGNDRRAIFKDDRDRRLLLDILQRISDRYHWLCHALRLHYSTISKVMKIQDSRPDAKDPTKRMR